MLHKMLPANPTLIDRWGFFLYWLFEGMALDWRRRGLRHVHHGEICQRVMGLWRRLRLVLEKHRAGTLRAARARVRSLGSTPHPDPPPQGGREIAAGEACAKRALPCWSVLPRRFGWLKSLILPDRQHCIIAFNWLLYDDAEMQAVIADAPQQVGRIVRPFCHFLGLQVPEALRLPKWRRVRESDPSPRPTGSSPVAEPHSPQGGEGEAARRGDERGEFIVPNRRLPAREQAEDAMRRSEAYGKPIDVKKLHPVAYGILLHPPRDGNCPPPEIGYGGRWRRPPKDYEPPPRDDE